jgi:hypothetical protein
MLIENDFIKVDMQRTDEDFIDYTIYDLVNNEIDGGVLENSTISYEDAYTEIINIHKDIIIKYFEED